MALKQPKNKFPVLKNQRIKKLKLQLKYSSLREAPSTAAEANDAHVMDKFLLKQAGPTALKDKQELWICQHYIQRLDK